MRVAATRVESYNIDLKNSKGGKDTEVFTVTERWNGLMKLVDQCGNAIIASDKATEFDNILTRAFGGIPTHGDTTLVVISCSKGLEERLFAVEG